METKDNSQEILNNPTATNTNTEGNSTENNSLPAGNEQENTILPTGNSEVILAQTTVNTGEWIKKTMSTAFNPTMIEQAKALVVSIPTEIGSVNQLFKFLLDEYNLQQTKIRTFELDQLEWQKETKELQMENQHLNESLESLLKQVETFVATKNDVATIPTENEQEIAPAQTAISNQPKANGSTWTDGINYLLETWNVK